MTGSVSILICTRNRAASLRATLGSIAGCDVPEDLAAELVVVDNGSTDGTEVVIREAAFHGCPVRRVLETSPGLSRARNAGLDATTSDVILFTDDDVRVPAGWIEGMCRPIFTGAADAMAGGVRFPEAYERVLSQEPYRSRRGWFASSEELDPRDPRGFVGANMAFSRRVATTLGGFDPQLGAGALGFFEEGLFAARLIEAGFRIGGALDISVEHHFDLDRLTRRMLLDLAARMGRSNAYVDYHWEQADAGLARAKAWRASCLLAAERIKAPRTVLAKHATRQEAQRVQTLSYWRQLAVLRHQPRRYARKAPALP